MHVIFDIPYYVNAEWPWYLRIIAGFAISASVTTMVKKRSKASGDPDTLLELAEIETTEACPAAPAKVSNWEIREATGSVPDCPAA